MASRSTDVRPSSETSTGSASSVKRPVAAASATRSASAAPTRSRSAASARTTTTAVVPSDGNALVRSRMVATSGIDWGSVSRLPAWVFMPSAGTASATTTVAPSSSAATGWRMTGASTRSAMPRRPAATSRGRVRRHSTGTRGRSTQRPSLASSAGSTVIEPSTAMATTRIAPTARLSKVGSSMRNRPAMAAITAPPETRIEWPEVWAAISTASRVLRPRARSSRSRFR